MARLAGHRLRGAGRGFTLVELLLTTALVLLLVGAVVFNFSTLQSGRELEEGSAQVEALLRFARAQAANTGRQVQINFEEEVAEGMTLSLGGIRVLWEPDPVGGPGTFVDLADASRYVQGITDLVEVQSVRSIDVNAGEPGGAPQVTSEEAKELGEELPDVFPPITFYPDGSGDSAEIVLSSRSADDHRRVAVRIVGLTGTIRREFVVDETAESEPENEQTKPKSEKTQSSNVNGPASPAPPATAQPLADPAPPK
jgi:prepilin-type N-terminal cleavage/methylation domain-containing protein